MTLKTTKNRTFLISAGLALLVLAAFEPIRHNEFIAYDDNDYITDNSHVKSGLTWKSVTWAFTSGRASNWHPLTWLSHMADIELFGLNPLGHHLHNLLLHTASTVLLFLLLHSMTGAVWPSAFVAMVFGIHPLRVESVAWAAERKDVLSMLFFLLTIAVYLVYVKRVGISRYLLVMLCFALGLMAKPMLVTLPVVLLLLDIWPLKRVSKNKIRLMAEKIPLFGLAIASCIVTYIVQKAGGSVNAIPLQTRIPNALSSYTAYLGKFFWPRNLAVLYPYPGPNYPLWPSLAASLFLIVFCVIAFYCYSRKSWFFTGWFWYVITLIPVIGLIQVGNQSIADRYTYLPSIGILILLAWSAAQFSSSWRHQKLILGVLSALAAIGMTVCTRNQISYWKNSISLFEHTLAITQYNPVIHNNLGWVFWKKGNHAEAFEHIQKALQFSPNFADANINMAALLLERKEHDKAMDYLHRVLKAKPNNFQANYTMALVLVDLKQYDQAAQYLLIALKNTQNSADIYYKMGVIQNTQNKNKEAIASYEQAITLNPKHFLAFNDLGALKYQQGLYEEAVGYFRRCLEINPNYAQAYCNLALVLQKQNKFEEAVLYNRKALEIEPENPETWLNLALTQEDMGQFQSASDSYHKVLQFDPNSIGAMNNLAWILAVNPDTQIQKPSEAISLAQRACSLTSFKNADILDTLAAAYASDRQFKQAIETAQKAMDLANAAGQKEKAGEISRRLQYYQAGKPYSKPLLQNQPPAPLPKEPQTGGQKQG
jgi:tetratricopeptide (TPR) repeat protein